MSHKIEFTKKEQQKAIDEIVRLLNKYKLTIGIEHQITIKPLEIGEAGHEE